MPISFDFPQGRLEPREPRVPNCAQVDCILIVIAAIVFGQGALSYWWTCSGSARSATRCLLDDVRLEWASSPSSPSLPSSFCTAHFCPQARQPVQPARPSDHSRRAAGESFIEPVLRIVASSARCGASSPHRDDAGVAHAGLFWFAPHATAASLIHLRRRSTSSYSPCRVELILGCCLRSPSSCASSRGVMPRRGFSLLDKRAAGTPLRHGAGSPSPSPSC